MLNTNQTKGLKIEPWILKAVKSAKDIVVRFYNGTNVLEIQDKNDQTIQYTFNSVYRYEGNWVMMYLNHSDSTENAILSTLRKGDVIDFYPRLNGNNLMDKVGLYKVELILTVKRYKRNSDVIQNHWRFILDDEISLTNGYKSITEGLDYKQPVTNSLCTSFN